MDELEKLKRGIYISVPAKVADDIIARIQTYCDKQSIGARKDEHDLVWNKYLELGDSAFCHWSDARTAELESAPPLNTESKGEENE